jgi:hypothetical protein
MDINKIFDGSLDDIANNIFNETKNTTDKAKAIQQQRIGENVRYVIDALKKIETDLRGEYSDVADKLSERITSIKDGQDGRNGADGRDGKDGRPGRDGYPGVKGADGLPGRDGIDGVDGVSVMDANIDFDGSLIITLSNGRVINVGEVVSQDLADKIQVISTMSTNTAVAAITGGTIDGAVIGGTTPAAGTFTTLASTGNYTITRAEPTIVLSNTGQDSWLIAAGGGGNISNGYLGFRNTTDGVTPFQIAPDAIANTAILTSTGLAVTGTLSATGVATFPAGTAALPSITTSGDTNTGVYFPAADTIAFTEGGAEAMRIDSSGNVGIGTATPGAKLQLNTGVTTTVGQIIQMVASQTADVLRVTRSDTNLSLQFTPSGQLSIGDFAAPAATVITTGPSTSTNANLKVSGSNVGNPNIFIQSQQGGGGALGGPTSFVYFGDNNRALSYIGGTKVNAFAANASSDLVFGTTSDISTVAVTERMRIDSSGNVGIGTASPTANYKLTLNTGGISFIGTQAANVTGAIDTQSYSMANGTYQYLSIFKANGLGGGAVGQLFGGYFQGQTGASAYTTGEVAGIKVGTHIKGAGSTITSAFGVIVDDQTVGTNNYGIHLNLSAGTNKYNIYAVGTAQNHFAANVLVGTTTEYNTGFTANANGISIVGTTAPSIALVDSTDTTNYRSWVANSDGVLYLWNLSSTSTRIGVGGVEQVRITHTASANRYITLTGSNGGNPTIGTSAGGLNLTAGGVTGILINATAGATRYLTVTPSNGGNPALGTDAGSLNLTPEGVTSLLVVPVATGNRYVTITASNGAAPIIGTSAGDLAFSPAGTERMRIDSSGNVLVGKSSATANGGDVQVSSGITFPATQVPKSDANTLDDYEEGTWTPSIGGTATYTTQLGFYTKIGRQVTITFDLNILVLGTGSTSNISGAPFTPAAGGNYYTGSVYWENIASSQISVGTFIQGTTGTIFFYTRSTAGTSVVNAPAIIGSGTILRCTMTYFI